MSSTGDNNIAGIAPPVTEKVIGEPVEAGIDEKNASLSGGTEGKERKYTLIASNNYLNKNNTISRLQCTRF